MEHFLILLISYILLSSPVTGGDQKWETLYKWGDSFSGYVWKGSGRKENLPTYKGDVKNGVPNGLGFLIYPDSRKYIGGWKYGLYHGQGTETSSKGVKYTGKWEYGYRSGQGTLTFPSGIKDVGEWNLGKFWKGTSYDKNGNIQYKFVNGKMRDP